uniref:Uncharacterized protein n=2 Tax=Clytia hemisphaerica TaxID=252671 RepID=A0A7M5X290_9CNID
MACTQNPCKNNAVCIDDKNATDQYRCNCTRGYTGKDCGLNINDCIPNKCINGRCIDLIENFTCDCTGSGFKGQFCETDLNECDTPNFCNNGTCKDRYGSFSCYCDTGYTGTNCESEINECQPDPCVNGTCTDKFASYECSCSPGYNGTNCDRESDECTFGYCENSIKCTDKFLDYECTCMEGYTGKNCTDDINECNSTSTILCTNGGQCVNTVGSYRCDCQPGYTGRDCSVNIQECDSNPCVNGTCLDGINNYTCQCDTGFTGRNCELDIDDCAVNNQPCENNGQCIDGLNDFTCQCISSWTGDNCTIAQDPCALFSPCANNATCSRDPTFGYRCNCSDEYGGQNCTERIGLCFPNNPCQNKGSCMYNTDFSNYTCQCPKGFEGRNCTDNINECERFPKLCDSLDWKAVCRDTMGSYECECSTKFQGPNCTEDVNECDTPSNCVNGKECFNSVAAKNNPNGYHCDCKPGWSGIRCNKAFFPCLSYLKTHGEPYCNNSGNCIDQGDDPVCNCNNTGYTGKQCEDEIDECDPTPCKNNGTCHDLINAYNCSCEAGFTGKNCQINIDECASMPCINGVCVDGINNYECQCYIGYEGKNCSQDIDYCQNVTCVNGGHCQDLNSTFTCNCFPGFDGKTCDVDINECQMKPCRYVDANGKVFENECIERSNVTAMKMNNFTVNETSFHDRAGYECICVTGLSGNNCSTNAQDCMVGYCKNNSTCVDLVDDYKCLCQPGYSGKNCSTDYDECIDEPCLNNGTCNNLINNYTCSCPANFTGHNCEREINYCTINTPCLNEGVCKPMGGETFKCYCAAGYTGEVCDIKTTFNMNGNGHWNITNINNQADTDVQFRFRTTVNRLLMTVNLQTTSVSFYLENGNLTMKHGDIKSTYATSTKNLVDGSWKHVKIYGNAQRTTIEVSGLRSQLFDAIKIHDLQSITVGGNSTDISSDFIGCMKDFSVNGKTYIESDAGHEGLVFGDCQRIEQCGVDSCNRHGNCMDEWISSSCQCFRQYFGSKCDQEIKSFGFQLPAKTVVAQNKTNKVRRRRRSTETSSNLYVRSKLTENYYKMNSTHGFSFLLRTRQPNGFVAILMDKEPTSADDATFQYILIEIINSYLKITHKSTDQNAVKVIHNESPELFVSNGQQLEITVTSSYLQIGAKKTDFQTPFPLTVNLVLMGGVDKPSLYIKTVSTTAMSGCLQAVKFGNNFLTNQAIPSSFTVSVIIPDSEPGFQLGCPGTPVCDSKPCLYNGTCVDQWNDFTCQCSEGFGGKTCSEFGCTLNDTCPASSGYCYDVPLSSPPATKCSQSMTYNGVNGTTTFTINQATNTSVSFSIRTRQESASILSMDNGEFQILIEDKKLVFTTNSGNQKFEDSVAINDGQSHTVTLETIADQTKLTIGQRINQKIISLLSSTWQTSITNQPIKIGAANGQYPHFQGCLSALQIAGNEISLEAETNTDGVAVGCQHSLDSCTLPSPCQNDGVCQEDFNDFKCECKTYYTSKTCNETINIDCSFDINLCQNNGTCQSTAVGTGPTFSQSGKDFFNCNCAAGFNGSLCQHDINDCMPDPCQNGGTCTDEVNGYQCGCVPGYTGTNCETDINECAGNPCQNGRQCTELVNDYECDCGGVFTGKNCQTDVDECLNATTCLHNGTCTNTVGGFSCACEPGYFSPRCQYSNMEICEVLKPCQNNATCLDSMAGYNCTCTEKYHGTNCTTLKVVEEDDNLPLIIGLSVAGAFILLLVACVCLYRYCKDKSGMEGTYSPNKEEQAGGNVEMHAVKKPKTERLI